MVSTVIITPTQSVTSNTRLTVAHNKQKFNTPNKKRIIQLHANMVQPEQLDTGVTGVTGVGGSAPAKYEHKGWRRGNTPTPWTQLGFQITNTVQMHVTMSCF